MRLHDRIAVVTGAARGIGRAIALRLASDGALVLAADLPSDDLRQIGADLAAISPGSRGLALDLRDTAAIAAFFARVGADHGRLHILVNNAAVSRQVGFAELTPDDIDQILQVNFRGTLLMMQHAAPLMRRAGWGRIVNLSSIAGKGFRQTSNIAYAGSKGAIVIMGRIAAAELGPHGITVNSVCPGLTETPLMLDWLRRRSEEDGAPVEEMRAKLAGASALGRINTPADVANAVAFLASDEAGTITGQSLNVDAGMMWD